MTDGKRYVKIVCESSIADIQIETLRSDQVPRIGGVFPPLPAVGIEGEGYSHCKYYLVEENDSETKETEIGFLDVDVKMDEGKLYNTIKISEGLLSKLVEHLGKII